MARIFITGSSDGLGSLAARELVRRGHRVVLHARNETRARDATAACPGAEAVLVGDLSSVAETKALAAAADELGAFDAVVHNAGLFRGGVRRTPEGLPALVAVNTLAPFVLTCLMRRPARLVYLSSSMHASSSGGASLDDVDYRRRGDAGWSDVSAYADSKMRVIMLANAFARRFEGAGVLSNAMDPGWVPTKMGGRSAPERAEDAVATYVKLALGEGSSEGVTGKYWFRCEQKAPRAEALDVAKQDELLRLCEEITGVSLPG